MLSVDGKHGIWMHRQQHGSTAVSMQNICFRRSENFDTSTLRGHEQSLGTEASGHDVIGMIRGSA